MEQEEKKFTCPECGAVITDASNDCPQCGYPSEKLKKIVKKLEDEEKRKEAARKYLEKEQQKEKMWANAGDNGVAANDSNGSYPVNHTAEALLNTVLSVELVITIIIGAVLIIGGIVIYFEYYYNPGILLGGIALGAFIILFGFILWAIGKVFLNISNNLFIMNERNAK